MGFRKDLVNYEINWENRRFMWIEMLIVSALFAAYTSMKFEWAWFNSFVVTFIVLFILSFTSIYVFIGILLSILWGLLGASIGYAIGMEFSNSTFIVILLALVGFFFGAFGTYGMRMSSQQYFNDMG